MALNTDPNFPPSGSAPYQIDREWCLGDSLTYINLNSANFDSRIETLSSTIASTTTTLSTVPYARLNDGNQSGVAPIFGARAWGRFDGTGANGSKTPLGSGNIASIVKDGTGEYTVTFATPMPTSNYAVTGTIEHAGTITRSVNMDITTQTTTSFRIFSGYASTLYNSGNIQFAVFC